MGAVKSRSTIHKQRMLFGAATAVIGLALAAHPSSAATLDDVMRRLDALEKRNDQLARENAALRQQVGAKPVAGAPAAAPKGNPVGHAAVATSPQPPAPQGGTVTVGGRSLFTKAGPMGPLIDNTTVTLYGHVDVSLILHDVGVFDQDKPGFAIGSNSSYFGIRARHNLSPYGYDGWAFLAQYEELVEVAATPTERAAFGSRDSYIGVEGPYGAVKIGKSDSPYKKATAAFDPFAGTVGDYNSIMGNTGGDNRAEFDWRMGHAIWYESPIFNGFQLSAMASPGQNYARDSSDFAYGDFNCTGSTPRGSGSAFPNGSPIGVGACTDGSFASAYSAAATFKNGGLTLIGAAELHQNVNRTGDEGGGLVIGGAGTNLLPDGSMIVTGIHDEWAAKVGGGYRFKDWLGDLQLYSYYEWMRREGAVAAFNERSRDGVFASITQFIGPWSFSGSYAHAFKTPGNPAILSQNIGAVAANPGISDADPTSMVQGNQFSDQASMYAIGTRYRFTDWASWYMVGALLQQSKGAHYCLGVSGGAFGLCSRDANNDTIGGATIKAVSTGITLDF
jgi:predicted porin